MTKPQERNKTGWNWRKLRKYVGHGSLLLAFTIYTIFGALIFRELERPAEILRLRKLVQNLEDRRLQVMKTSVLCTFRASKCKQLFDDYEKAIAEACQGGVPLPHVTTDEVTSKWTFAQAAFFASTVITTIGYGNTVPKTFAGRLFCIFFALIGIPLTLTLIANLGVLLATALSNLYDKLLMHLPKRAVVTRLSMSVQRWLFALAGVVFLIFYLGVGALVFMILEADWGFFEGFYFCFITMTTIGFGDFVPTSPNYMFMCMLYIIVGLALTSTIIELVRRQYVRSWKTIRALSGPLAESLRRLGDNAGSSMDLTTFQNDLRKVLAAMSVPRKTDDGKEWQDAIDSVFRDIGIKSPTTKKCPQVLQIVVYETTV